MCTDPGVHAQTHVSSAPQTCTPPPPRGRGAPQGPSQLILTCGPLSSDTHICSEPSRHAYAYSIPQWCTHTCTHTVRSTLTHVGAHSCSYTYSYTQRYTRSYTQKDTYISVDPLASHTSSDAVQCLASCSPCEHTDHRDPHIHVYSASHKPPCSDPEKPPHARSPHMCIPSKALFPCTRTWGLRGVHMLTSTGIDPFAQTHTSSSESEAQMCSDSSLS